MPGRRRGRAMDKSFATREWLEWLTRVRLLTITLILTIGVVWPQYIPGFSSNRFFLPLIIFWITLGILHLILLRGVPQARWHGGSQVAGDVVMISLLVYATGLQDFTEDIIHSMRGGLITTDLSGRILLLNRAGEEILGHRFAELRGRRLQELNDDFWLPNQYENSERLSLRKEIDFLTPSGQVRYLGISISPLRSRDSERNGYVFNFQDLTDLRRLEQEVATKERMAALGRLSAAIAHEIRQPLTAVAGAVKELARLVPLEEDEKHLVNIVSRESERLNNIITDFLNYSRETTYEFQHADVRGLLDETLMLMEKKPEIGSKYQIVRAFNGKELHARGQ